MYGLCLCLRINVILIIVIMVKDKRIWMNINYTEIEKFRTISFIFEIREELYKNWFILILEINESWSSNGQRWIGIPGKQTDQFNICNSNQKRSTWLTRRIDSRMWPVHGQTLCRALYGNTISGQINLPNHFPLFYYFFLPFFFVFIPQCTITCQFAIL